MSLARDTAAFQTQSNGHIESKLIGPMREAVALVQLCLFQDLRRDLAQRDSSLDERQQRLLAGAVVNNLFSTPTKDPEASRFAATSRIRIEAELRGLAARFPELCELLTDGLRMQTICDQQEGINSLPALFLARAVGILREERPLPLPSTFMLAVRSLGTSRGLLQRLESTGSSRDESEGNENLHHSAPLTP